MSPASFYSYLAIPAFGILSGCQTALFECDVHAELCPGLIIAISSPSVIKKSAAGAVAFTVTLQPGGKPEDPAKLTATLLSIGSDIKCSDALHAAAMPKPPRASLRNISCSGNDMLTCKGMLDKTELSSLTLGTARLCVHGRDAGDTITTVANKTLVASQMSSLTLAQADFAYQTTTPLEKIVPLSVGISKQKISLLFQGVNAVPSDRQQINIYNYMNKSPVAFINDAGGSTPIIPGCLAATNSDGVFLLWTMNGIAPMTPSACFLKDPKNQISCTLDGDINNKINDKVLALAVDPVRSAFAVATDNKLRGYTYSPLKQKWEVSRDAGNVRLALGEIDAPSVTAADTADTVAIWPTSNWPNNGLVKVIIGDTEQAAYSNGLGSALTAALNSIKPTPPIIIDAFAVGDLDGDGLSDVVVGSGPNMRILLNQGAGAFRLGGAGPFITDEVSLNINNLPPGLKDIVIGDVDGNPGNEIVVLSSSGQNSAQITTFSIM